MNILNSLSKSLLCYLSPGFRKQIVRAALPTFETNLDGITFRPAFDTEDYTNCFRLLHDVYVGAGFSNPSRIPLRIVPHHSDPKSRVFLGSLTDNSGETVPIYTASLFPDHEQGLPMDIGFKREVDVLRNQGHNLVEVGCLASHPLYRKGNKNIPMLGNRLIWWYAAKILQADDLLITVHPKYLKIYEDILLFERIGWISSYSYVNNNPAVALRLNLKTMAQKYKKAYAQKPTKKNLYHFFFEAEPTCIDLSLEKGKQGVERYYGLDMINRVLAAYSQTTEAQTAVSECPLTLVKKASLPKVDLGYIG
ncbi:N-acyl-L-homoserine lactone synthetase [uncultured Desulfobacter sp.]|uniref:N-acyl amino acid synthase FeeM domain-containing protein n=1 Tax=uncultured Desulfobacter sp. TaxID=240139 RepID=UPI002AABB4A2|nr:N-acyl-L-homoserine lactone synthetase [uncultured Desulfobacter sp.]